MATLNTLKFTKMHGAGNDFVVLDNCAGQLDLSPGLIKRLSDRHFGV
ncbi:MAG TPA: diaminopimelate epimerase, partial [Limnobacter sp.]|nr:diaminopimelate epimerase [Limnobacter sp.]